MEYTKVAGEDLVPVGHRELQQIKNVRQRATTRYTDFARSIARDRLSGLEAVGPTRRSAHHGAVDWPGPPVHPLERGQARPLRLEEADPERTSYARGSSGFQGRSATVPLFQNTGKVLFGIVS